MKEITVCLRIQTRMRRPTVYFMAYAFQYKQIFAFMKRVNGLGVNVRGEQRL